MWETWQTLLAHGFSLAQPWTLGPSADSIADESDISLSSLSSSPPFSRKPFKIVIKSLKKEEEMAQ